MLEESKKILKIEKNQKKNKNKIPELNEKIATLEKYINRIKIIPE